MSKHTIEHCDFDQLVVAQWVGEEVPMIRHQKASPSTTVCDTKDLSPKGLKQHHFLVPLQ